MPDEFNPNPPIEEGNSRTLYVVLAIAVLAVVALVVVAMVLRAKKPTTGETGKTNTPAPLEQRAGEPRDPTAEEKKRYSLPDGYKIQEITTKGGVRTVIIPPKNVIPADTNPAHYPVKK